MKIAPFAALAAIASLVGVPASSQTAPRVPAPPAPPAPPPLDGANQALNRWTPVTIRCGEEQLPVTAIVPIKPELGWPFSAMTEALGRSSLDFAIDASGRPVDIVRSPTGSYTPFNGDLAPALAVSRFPAGRARDACHVTFVLKQVPLAEASPADLMAASVNTQTRFPRVAIDRMNPVGSNCSRQPPAPLLRGFPDFAKLKPAIGQQNWSMLQYDLDGGGKPVGIKVVAGTGNAAFEAAARKAVEQSRYSGGKRSGCLYAYWQNAAPLAPPPMPEKSAFAADRATCPADNDWVTQPNLIFPDNYRRRGVEGWAIIGFDVAPWGATGNVRVLRAEPSADFGEAGMNVVRGAMMAKSDRGYVGCVERVRYVMSGRRADGEIPIIAR
jgi:outer membrane biosynthesis protein TonB